MLKEEFEEDGEWIQIKERLKRQFTVRADMSSTLLTLSINDINRMQREFLEAYTKLMEASYARLEYICVIKVECIEKCEKVQRPSNSHSVGRKDSQEVQK